MKVVIATPLYPPESGGPATYTHILENGFPEKDIQVKVVKFKDVRHLPKVLRHAAYFWNVFCAAKGANAVLGLDAASVGLPTLFAARLRKVPFVVKIVGDYAWEQGTQRFGISMSLDEFVRTKQVPFAVRLLRRMQEYVASHAVRIIVPSEYLRGIVMAWGIPGERIEVIYNAIELGELGVIPESVSLLRRPRVVTIGRLVPWKHIDGVLQAVAQIPDASLAIVGDGPERTRLEVEAGNIADRVCFTGAVPHADALAILQDADILVLNSSYEGLSHLLIEALMLGKAIVTTRVGGNPELITDGQNGLLVPPHDTPALSEALRRVMVNAELRSRLQVQAKASSARFSPNAMLQATAKLLKSV